MGGQSTQCGSQATQLDSGEAEHMLEPTELQPRSCDAPKSITAPSGPVAESIIAVGQLRLDDPLWITHLVLALRAQAVTLERIGAELAALKEELGA